MDGKSTQGLKVVPKDIKYLSEIITLVEEFAQETSMPFFNVADVTDVGAKILSSEDGVSFILVDSAVKVVGFIGGYVGWYPYDTSKAVLNEVLWFVTKEHRGSREAYKMFKKFLEVGEDFDGVTFTNQVNLNSSALDKVLTKNGFNNIERNYVKVN